MAVESVAGFRPIADGMEDQARLLVPMPGDTGTAWEREVLVLCTSRPLVITLQSLMRLQLIQSPILDQRQKNARTGHALRRAWVAGTVRRREDCSRFARIHHWVDSRFKLLGYLRSLCN